MENNINFKQLWQEQYIEQMNIENIILKAKKYNKSKILQLIIMNLTLISTAIFIIAIWIFFQPNYISTKVGIIITVLAIIMTVVANNKTFKFINLQEENYSNQDYLINLKQLKQKQKHIQTTIMSLYFFMLSLGLALYLYEYASRMSFIWAVGTYVITFAWILINWFYFKPMTIKKQNKKLDLIINELENINDQLKNNEI